MSTRTPAFNVTEEEKLSRAIIVNLIQLQCFYTELQQNLNVGGVWTSIGGAADHGYYVHLISCEIS